MEESGDVIRVTEILEEALEEATIGQCVVAGVR